jgi:GAF domain-containing protein
MLNASTGRPSTGLLAKRDANGQLVVSWVVPSGLAYDLSIRPGAIVIADGDPGVAGSASNEIDLSQARKVEVWQDGNRILVDTEQITGSTPLRRWGYALLGLIFLVVGGSVFVKARQRTAASAFYVFCVSTAIALAIAMVTYLLYGWALALQFAVVLVVAASFAYFFFQFPVPAAKTHRERLIFVVVLATSAATVLGGYIWVLITSPSNYALIQPIYFLYLASCAGAGLLRLFSSFIGERSQEIRRQRLILVIGTALAVGPSLMLGLLPSLIVGRALISIDTTAFSFIFIPLFFAYAITQHQLLGIRGFIRRSVVYLIMGFTVLIAFFIVAAAASRVLPEGWAGEEEGILGFGLFVFLIAVSFGYVQKRVEWMVDRFIYHDAYDYKQALLEFSTQLAAEQDLSALSQELVERTCRMMNLDCGTLLLAVHPGEVSAMVARNAPPAVPTGVLAGEVRGHASADENGDALLNPALVTGPLFTTVRQATRSKETIPNVHDRDSDSPYLMAYAHYGDCADWLPQSLQSELARQNIDLRHTSAPTELFSFFAGPAYRATTTVNNAVTTGPFNVGPFGRRHGDSEDTLLHKLTSSRHFSQDAMRPFLGVPLWTRQHFVGILCLGSKKTGERYGKDDLSLLTTLGGQGALAIYNAQLYEMREQALLDTITALAHAIEAKDTYTLNHCEKITGRAVALGQALGLPHHEVVNIRLGSILHDVGKIGIPDAILNKPAKLTDAEYEQVKEHAVIGARIVQSVGALQGVVPIVRHHQERFDGSGYPDGLRGDAIPIGARIIAVVDAYGAMTEDRVYRKAPGHEVAIAELKRWAGKQFDPYIAEAFIRLLEVQPDMAEA